MSLFDDEYFVVKKSGLSQFQAMTAYLGGSCFQTVMDNPITAYRQLVQQYAKDLNGNVVDPKVARGSLPFSDPIPSKHRFLALVPELSVSVSSVFPNLASSWVFPFLGEGESPGFVAATGASILSAPFINPIRMIEKQQRAFFKQTGQTKPIMEILRESAAKNFVPLFRGTVPSWDIHSRPLFWD
ncbi:hypothetical protein MHU86_9744 [Fragilaria crotonensis]|nr:hypothetical protein MHU86_9744 [Fragilaria crotonensis]